MSVNKPSYKKLKKKQMNINFTVKNILHIMIIFKKYFSKLRIDLNKQKYFL